MGMDVGGPSVATLYSNAGGQGKTPDTGLGMGNYLGDSELAARTRYAPPTVPSTQEVGLRAAQGAGVNDIPNEYNMDPGLPVKYDVPSAQKERMQLRQSIREAQDNVLRTDPITDEEVNYLSSMKDQAELADFDRYVNKLIDPRKPGNLKWLMEIYPEYVNRRIQQVHTDYEFALRNQMIDSWGINTFDDLHFKYLADQGKVDGPRLNRHHPLSDEYAPGLLSPWTFMGNGDIRTNLKLPFASAKFGRRPAADNKENWALNENGQPLSKGRGTQQLANSMYRDGVANSPRMQTALRTRRPYDGTSNPTGIPAY
jgi:hypothetical protein